ncbi:hypothetical protein J3P91_05800 [Pseudomonas sp. Z4-7]|uniref:hypothetical protein n=1 Tax=Pseudomonas sp. Z4-7 TaxID=2817413 RepID=UPI003DA97B25
MPKRLLPAEKNSKEEKAAQYRYFRSLFALLNSKIYFCYKPGKAINDIPRQ